MAPRVEGRRISPAVDTMSDLRPRHPEKAHKPDNPVARKPDWIRVKAPVSKEYHETRNLMRALKLNTVCEEAACPNIGECWKQKHATVMILGSVCTRACTFCNVATGRPDQLDPHEPEHVAEATSALGLAHIVVTSVDRDDLDDGGAMQFVRVIEAMLLYWIRTQEAPSKSSGAPRMAIPVAWAGMVATRRDLLPGPERTFSSQGSLIPVTW